MMLNQVLCNRQKSQEDRKQAQLYIVQQKSVLKQDFTYAKGHMLHIKQVVLTVVNTATVSIRGCGRKWPSASLA